MPECEICAFKNPKVTATAVIFNEGRLLVAKRNEEPFRGQWDLIGGYASEGEGPEQAMRRELKEELDVEAALDLIGCFPGVAFHKDHTFPIASFVYLAEPKGEIRLNSRENSELRWVGLNEIKEIAFDSNKKILEFVKRKLAFNLEEVRELVKQLDPTAEVKEYSLYRAVFNGHLKKEYDDQGRLIGLGWIFPRQTMLRKQAVIEDMVVAEAMRGKGLGRKILEGLVAWAKDQGVEVIELTSNPKRVAANNLYKSFGFQLHPTNHYLYRIQ